MSADYESTARQWADLNRLIRPRSRTVSFKSLPLVGILHVLLAGLQGKGYAQGSVQK